MPKVQNHIHTYTRMRGSKSVYKCAYPDCTHFANVALIEGKYARCPYCQQEFILTYPQLRLKTPKCNDCVETRGISNRDRRDMIGSLLDNVLLDIPDETMPDLSIGKSAEKEKAKEEFAEALQKEIEEFIDKKEHYGY